MRNKSERLTFFCQLCDENIQGNICPTHGIDFVTIKKVRRDDIKSASKKSDKIQRINGMLQLEEEGTSTDVARENRVVVSEENLQETSSSAITAEMEKEAQVTLKSPTAHIPGTVDTQPVSENVFHPEDDIKDAEYQEITADEVPHYSAEQINTERSGRRRSSNKDLIIALVAIIGIIVFAGGYFAMFYNSDTPTSLYSRAEQLYSEGNYTAATKAYTKLMTAFPNDPLAGMAQQKIGVLQQPADPSNVITQEQQAELQSLMIKANVAFQKEQYIFPKDDNVVKYTKSILKIDPNFQPALALQDNLITHFEMLANAAVQDKNYDGALGFYTNILEIHPNNPKIRKAMQNLLELKSKQSQN